MRMGFLSAVAALMAMSAGVDGAEIRLAAGDDVRAAVAAAQPGDALVLADGIHADLKIVLDRQGTADKPITLRPQTPGGAILTGGSRVTILGKHLVVQGLVFDQAWGSEIVRFEQAERCRMTDCAFIECGNPRSTFSHIITLTAGSHHNRVDHCYMQGNLSMGMGVRVKPPDDGGNTDNQLDHNWFRDIVRRSSNGQESVQVGQGEFSEKQDVRTLVEYCLFERANGDAEIISNKSSRNTYRCNTFRDCARAELVLRGGHYALVEGNYFLKGMGGVRVHGSHHVIINNHIEGCGRGIQLMTGSTSYNPVRDCLMAHNTILCQKDGIILGQMMGGDPVPDGEPANNRFANNLLVADLGQLIRQVAGRETRWQNNLVWTTGKAMAGLEAEGLRRADPRLVEASGIHRLPEKESPAIDSAIPVAGVTIASDIDGRPRDARPDIGCDEASGAAKPRGPLTGADVGPAWMAGDTARIRRIPAPKPIPSLPARGG